MLSFFTERAGFAWLRPIIYSDTDDVISQMPECLSDMFHWAELRMASSKSQAPKSQLLTAASAFDVTFFTLQSKGQNSIKEAPNWE